MLKVSAISLFLKIISPFSFGTMSLSALRCLFEKQGLLVTQGLKLLKQNDYYIKISITFVLCTTCWNEKITSNLYIWRL